MDPTLPLMLSILNTKTETMDWIPGVCRDKRQYDCMMCCLCDNDIINKPHGLKHLSWLADYTTGFYGNDLHLSMGTAHLSLFGFSSQKARDENDRKVCGLVHSEQIRFSLFCCCLFFSFLYVA